MFCDCPSNGHGLPSGDFFHRVAIDEERAKTSKLDLLLSKICVYIYMDDRDKALSKIKNLLNYSDEIMLRILEAVKQEEIEKNKSEYIPGISLTLSVDACLIPVSRGRPSSIPEAFREYLEVHGDKKKK